MSDAGTPADPGARRPSGRTPGPPSRGGPDDPGRPKTRGNYPRADVPPREPPPPPTSGPDAPTLPVRPLRPLGAPPSDAGAVPPRPTRPLGAPPSDPGAAPRPTRPLDASPQGGPPPLSITPSEPVPPWKRPQVAGPAGLALLLLMCLWF